MNSTGAFKQQKKYVVTTPIVGGQWIAQFSTSALATTPQVQPVSSDDIYVVTESKTIKLNSSGNLTFANLLSGYEEGVSTCTDSSDNLYFGGTIDNYPVIIKYDSSGNILWQKRLSTSLYSRVSSIQVATNGDVFALVGTQMPISTTSLSSAPMTVFKLDSTGALLSQRKVLKSTTTATECLFIDNVNSKLHIVGTEYVGSGQPTKILTGTYGLSNTDVAESMTSTSKTSTNVYIGRAIWTYKSIVADDTYVYIIGTAGADDFFAKINKSTGAVSYSYSISEELYGITMDTSGYMYIFGNSGNNDIAGYGILFKVRMSDGVIIWSKKIGLTSLIIFQATWSNNFVYLVAQNQESGYKSACMKLSDSGSVTSGTYNGWSIQDLSLTSTTVSLSSTTTTGTNTTTAYTTPATTYTQSTASVTITTTNIS